MPNRAFCSGWKRGKTAQLRPCLHFDRGLQAEKKLGAKNNFLPPVWSCRWGWLVQALLVVHRGRQRGVPTPCLQTLGAPGGCVCTVQVGGQPSIQRRPGPHLQAPTAKGAVIYNFPTFIRQSKMEGLLFNVNNGYVILSTMRIVIEPY